MLGTIPVAPAATTTTYDLTPFPTSFNNDVTYNFASVSAMQGLRHIWYPLDDCSNEFLRINTNFMNTDSNTNVNTLLGIVSGAAAGAPFRIDCFVNYEVIAAPGSTLQGMETLIEDKTDPYLVIQDLICNHRDFIVQAVPAQMPLRSLLQGQFQS